MLGHRGNEVDARSVHGMCGRFTSTVAPADLAAYFEVDELATDDLGPRWNVAPTDSVYAVAESASSGRRRLGTFRWGLVPFFAKDASGGARMINARAETLLDKPAFRRPFERYRCLIPADGFYEWEAVEGRARKQPWYFRREDGDLLAFAGLWSVWRPTPGSDEGRLVTCTIVTGPPNDLVRRVHDRMPVVLPPSTWDAWLDPGNDDVDALRRLLVPAPADLFTAVAVSDAVSNVRNDGPHLLEPAP
jgi:putative SOS response-associated peptidase YedK